MASRGWDIGLVVQSLGVFSLGFGVLFRRNSASTEAVRQLPEE